MEPETAELMAQAKRDFDASKYKQAAGVYEQVVEAEPGNALAWQELGRALSGSGKRDEAEAAARRALQLDPNLALPYNTIGLGLMSRGKLDEAEAEFRKGLERDPESTVLALNMASIPLQRGAFDQAVPLLQQVVEHEPGNVTGLIILGYAFTKTGHLDKAEKMLMQARVLDPSNHYLPCNLVVVYRQQGRFREALPPSIDAFRVRPSFLNALVVVVTVLTAFPRALLIVSFLLASICLLVRSVATQAVFVAIMVFYVLDASFLLKQNRRSLAILVIGVILVLCGLDLLLG